MMSTNRIDLREPSTILIALGMSCVIIGGVIAAVTAPLDLDHGSWTAAYLVLVGGVSQYVMGYARRWYATCDGRAAWAQIALWNAGNVIVIIGTAIETPALVSSASVLLVVALAIALRASRPGTGRRADSVSPVKMLAYRLVLLGLTVSIGIGIALSYIRHS